MPSQQPEVTGDNTPQLLEGMIRQSTDAQRATIYKDIEQTFGFVPGFLKLLPATHLAGEWRIFKEFQLNPQTALDAKTKELIGLAVAGALHCPYCTYFHTMAAGMNGATAAEIDEALLMAKQTAGWSSFLNGVRYDMDQLKDEMTRVKTFVQSQQKPRA